MQDDLGIDRGLKNRAARFQPGAHLFGIDQVAVMRNRHRAVRILGQQGWVFLSMVEPAVE